MHLSAVHSAVGGECSAAWHLQEAGKQGTVRIRSEYMDGKHMISVSDDGIVFDVEKVLEEIEQGKRISTGIKNVKFRLEQMINASLIIESSVGNGTTAVVSSVSDAPK